MDDAAASPAPPSSPSALSETSTGPYATDTVIELQTNLDDLSPELLAPVLDQLLAAGALDAFFTPVQMKKGRPGVLLTALAEPAAVERLAGVIFRETTSFGLRLTEKRRLKLDRRFENVGTPYGEIPLKLGFDSAGTLLQVSPEFESCRAAADAAGVPVRAVYREALAAQGQAPVRQS
jgi:uncharacterized protein (DUF111 family)